MNSSHRYELEQDLFTYIRKNKTIPAKLSYIKDDDPQLNQLRVALHAGDPNAEIFSNSKCDIYLFYLIQKGEINLRQGITVYSYLMVLMQFSDKQNLRKGDEDLKEIREVEVHHLAEEGKISLLGEKVIQYVIDQYQIWDYKINEAELKNFILDLPKSEQWLTKLPIYQQQSAMPTDFDNMIELVAKKTPFIYSEKAEHPDKVYYYLPSISLINFLLHKMSKQPLNMRFIFGNINFDTLLALHQNDFHPIQLYSKRIASNPYSVHEDRCGPVGQFFHDVLHMFVNNIFKKNERQAIFDSLIPALARIEKIARKHLNPSLSKQLKTLITELIDLNFSEFSVQPPNERLQVNLQALGKKMFNLPHYPNQIDSPRLMFAYLIETLQPPLNEREKRLITNLGYSQPSPSSDSNVAVLALIKIANAKLGEGESLHVPNLDLSTENEDIWNETDSESDSDGEEFELIEKKAGIDWATWLALLEKPMEDKERWEILKNEHYDDLLTLITTYGLDYYPPFLPMTEKKHELYLTFFREQVALQAKSIPKEKPLESNYFQFGQFAPKKPVDNKTQATKEITVNLSKPSNNK